MVERCKGWFFWAISLSSEGESGRGEGDAVMDIPFLLTIILNNEL